MKNLVKISLSLMLLVMPLSLLAESEVDLPEKESIETSVGNDFYSAGSIVQTGSKVEDDAYLAGAMVSVTGEVGGDVVAAGSNIVVTGNVGGDLRLAGSMLSVLGKVGQSALLAGGVVNVGSEAIFGAESKVAGGVLIFSGQTNGNLAIAGDEITFGGVVNGDLLIEAEKLEFTEGAKITGKLTYSVPKPLELPATLAKEIDYKEYKSGAHEKAEWKSVFGKVFFYAELFSLAVAFVTGAVLLAFLGNVSVRISEIARKKFWHSLFFGLLALLTPLAILLLLISGVGALLGGLLLAVWLGLLLATMGLSAFVIGSFVLRPGKSTSYLKKLGILLIGMLITMVLGLIPGFGFPIQLTIFVFSLGVLLRTKQDLYKAAKKAKLV
jgi:hypothetical protein